jgi:hypothetical protein
MDSVIVGENVGEELCERGSGGDEEGNVRQEETGDRFG